MAISAGVNRARLPDKRDINQPTTGNMGGREVFSLPSKLFPPVTFKFQGPTDLSTNIPPEIVQIVVECLDDGQDHLALSTIMSSLDPLPLSQKIQLVDIDLKEFLLRTFPLGNEKLHIQSVVLDAIQKPSSVLAFFDLMIGSDHAFFAELSRVMNADLAQYYIYDEHKKAYTFCLHEEGRQQVYEALRARPDIVIGGALYDAFMRQHYEYASIILDAICSKVNTAPLATLKEYEHWLSKTIASLEGKSTLLKPPEDEEGGLLGKIKEKTRQLAKSSQMRGVINPLEGATKAIRMRIITLEKQAKKS